jgi:hypothetical protein
MTVNIQVMVNKLSFFIHVGLFVAIALSMVFRGVHDIVTECLFFSLLVIIPLGMGFGSEDE